ncbi:DUF1254 domain-containing protein [Mesorhizobium sp. WSM4307]|uniref:DUF1254 domain-containing protein n=1 Tax=unclassified Mesorhizobium TaxID=325217 RepID=UPI000BAF1D89|nr:MULTISPECIES: DUF1254 domain-containing protein [unclassified Mesorhizobium]PBC18646.1 hypothetical protein CK226_33815 [Mesorhizobium sp. WSM4311]TRC73367.1 DUF1254 domain-containing protein [Mesorhizobium sp. WSM4310]TRC78076.1 DUF1254 domain-containing protein [Mesorhizobium sp. WSM4315]TRC79265.1 DUF1254 domain-containing protein [Mesorhizobium sp. WSM4307]TRC90899.1 DUF1254 domain-containing protein [Mesorhizobium sp. WSM4305]
MPLVQSFFGSILLCLAVALPAQAQDAPKPTSWQEQYAYSLGLQAYVFGFPYVYLPSLRWNWVTVPKPAGSITPYAPLNHFYNVRDLATAEYRDGGSPNNDTLYSIAWIDVSKEPLILTHPDMGDRYFTFELASIDSDNFAYVGTRTTGGKAGSYAIIGPNWKGQLPAGVKSITPSRTNSVLILGRTLVDGPADLPVVRKLQDQYTLIPLSQWGKAEPLLPASRDVWAPFDAKTDPLGEWKTMNRAMTENPPEARLAKLTELFAKIGIGPGQDIDKLDEDTKRGLARASKDGFAMLHQVIRSGALGKRVNGWNIPPKAMGTAGLIDDFLLRASIQCLGGIIANDPDEAVYYNTALDQSGQPLDGNKQYAMRFAPGQLPEVKAFWSITMYDPTYNLVANSINRYAIGNRTPNLKTDADGGLTLYIQSEAPSADKMANWLPSPKAGSFTVIMRTYMPDKAIVDQTWAPPGVAPAR